MCMFTVANNIYTMTYHVFEKLIIQGKYVVLFNKMFKQLQTYKFKI